MFAVYYTRNGENGRKVFNSLKKRNEWIASAPFGHPHRREPLGNTK